MRNSIISQALDMKLDNSDSLKSFISEIKMLPSNCTQTKINKLAKTFCVEPSIVKAVHCCFRVSQVGMPLPEPSEQVMTATKLAKQLYKTISKYIGCESYERKMLVLWILQTWFIDYVCYVPYLFIDSPEAECGKTQTLTLLMQTCRKAALFDSTTVASIPRVMTSDTPPTLLIDESDCQRLKFGAGRDFINGGYQRTSSVVKADLNDQTGILTFSAFGNKVFAGIDLCQVLNAATVSRGIVFRLKRRKASDGETCFKDMTIAALNPGWKKLREYLRRMEIDYAEEFEKSYINEETPLDFPKGITSARAKQIWRGIFVLAYLETKKYGDETLLNWAKEAMLQTRVDREDFLSSKERFCRNLKEIIKNTEDSFISTQAICNALNENPEWGWCDMNNSKGISVRHVSLWIKSYGIESHREQYMDSKSMGFYTKDLKKFLDKK